MKSGQLEYTARARRQDSSQAMDNDLMNALVELLTNADDAYLRNSDYTSPIFVACDKARLVVIDEAGGLSFPDMLNCFTKEGVDTHTDGVTTRGLFGRGAKDCAIFGSITFVSKHSSGASWVRISENGYQADNGYPLLSGMASASSLLNRNGLMAVVEVRTDVDKVKIATANKMVVSYPIRKILERRPVHLSYDTFRTKFKVVEPVGFHRPIFVACENLPRTRLEAEIAIRNLPSTEISFKNAVEVGSKLHALALERFDIPVQEIKPYHVELQIKNLETYLQHIDKRSNSTESIIKRDRSGLTKDTEFYTDVKVFVETSFALFQQQEKRRKRSEANDTINKQLTNLAAKLADTFTAELREANSRPECIDASFPAFVPPFVKLAVGESKSVALYLDKPALVSDLRTQHGPNVSVAIQPQDTDIYGRSENFELTVSGLTEGSERVSVPWNGRSGMLRVDIGETNPQPAIRLKPGFNPSRITSHRNQNKTVWYLPDNQRNQVSFDAETNDLVLQVSSHRNSEHGLCYKLTVSSGIVGEYVVYSSENRILHVSIRPEAMRVDALSVELLAGDSSRGYLTVNDGGGHTVNVYKDHPAMKLAGFAEETYLEGIPTDSPAYQCTQDAIVNIVVDHLLSVKTVADPDILVDYDSVLSEREQLFKRFVRLFAQ